MLRDTFKSVGIILKAHQNKFMLKKFVKIGLRVKKLRFWPVVPLDPLYLGNRKSYVKSVDTLPKGL